MLLYIVKIDKDLALFYGVLLGDGCLGRYGGQYVIAITGNLKDDVPFYDNVLTPLISKLRGKPTHYRTTVKGNRIDFHIYDKLFLNEIHSLGFPIGKKGPLITIPQIFYEKKLLKYVVQGIMATDGSLVLTKNPNKFYPRIELRVIHKHLIKQIYDYLISIEMKGHLYLSKSKPNPLWRNPQQQYRFQFNGRKNIDVFIESVGFVNPKQIIKLNLFIKYSKLYDKSIKNIPSQRQRYYRPNSYMALRGFEPPITAL